MGFRYAVVTRVNRDDQPDGGARIFARTIQEIRSAFPAAKSKCSSLIFAATGTLLTPSSP